MTSITSQAVTALAHAANTMHRGRALMQQLIRNWDEHAAISQLRRLDDKLLRDAGIDRNDLEWVANLPLSISPKEALKTRVRRP